MPRSFEKQYTQLVEDNLNAMYGWAEKPLKDYVARDSAKDVPVFPLSTEARDDVSPKMLAQTVTDFLKESYEAAFGSPEIPWVAVASHPNEYYNTIKYHLAFTSSGLAELTRTQWDALATTLALGTGGGTSGFFRKLSAVAREEEEAEDARQKQEAEEARQKGEEDVHLKQEAEEARQKREEEEARHMVEADEARKMKEAEEACRREEEEGARRSGEGEQGEGEPAPAPKKRGRKRKADTQLVPAEVPEEGAAQRIGRTRQTPDEAKLERQKKLAATVGAGKVKPSFSYELAPKSPVKPKRTERTRVVRELKSVHRT